MEILKNRTAIGIVALLVTAACTTIERGPTLQGSGRRDGVNSKPKLQREGEKWKATSD
jgi:hypothetical protein